jgi:hypothetical protein
LIKPGNLTNHHDKNSSCINCLILISSLVFSVYAVVSPGFKKGDWIEYTVTFNGSLNPGHDVNWARMGILEVDRSKINVDIKSTFQDCNSEHINYTLDLQTGHLIDDFTIPANLKAGDLFLDENFGNLNISHSEQRAYAGVQRKVLHGQPNRAFTFGTKLLELALKESHSKPTILCILLF